MVDALGYTAGFLAMISFLPQVVKTFRRGKADDISLGMLLMTLTTNILYVVYGLMLKLYPIIIMIGIATGIIIVQIILTLSLRHRTDLRRGKSVSGA